MNKPISLFIALRYAKASKQSKFVGLISSFSKAGIALGVMALIMVISVMDGFEGVLKNRILGAVPHVTITSKNNSDEQIVKLFGHLQQSSVVQEGTIKQVLPQTMTSAIIQLPNSLQGAMVQGLAKEEAIPSGLRNAIVNGQWEDLMQARYGVVVGQYFAYEKGIGMGDRVRLMLSGGSHYTPLGRMPAQRNFTVIGFFRTESELDSQVVFTRAQDLNKLMRKPKDHIASLRLVLADPFQAEHVVTLLRSEHALSEFDITTWHESHGKLFSAVKMEKNMMWFMLSLIIAVAAFNIVSALVMMVTQKQSEIAILKTLGLAESQISKIFYLQGTYNGLVGALIGTAVGSVLALGVNDFMLATGINLFGVPGVGLPVEFSFTKVLGIASFAILLALLASLYPAHRAAKMAPAQILRYE